MTTGFVTKEDVLGQQPAAKSWDFGLVKAAALTVVGVAVVSMASLLLPEAAVMAQTLDPSAIPAVGQGEMEACKTMIIDGYQAVCDDYWPEDKKSFMDGVTQLAQAAYDYSIGAFGTTSLVGMLKGYMGR